MTVKGMEEYKILLEGAEAETELKKSRFIAHVKAVETEEEAVSFVNSIKKEFYDARHNPYAYVIGKDGDRVKYSDDGEPAQTAGLPIYNVLKETKIRNIAIVVTRYFGGTLLGAGPLARMYGEAAALAVKNSKIGIMKYGIEFTVDTDYSNGEKVRSYLNKNEIMIVSTDYSESVSFTVRSDFKDFSKIEEDIVSLTASRVKITKKNEAYFIDKG